MSLLTIVQSVALRTYANKPTVAVTSADPAILQIVELINEDGQELARRHNWQALTSEATFMTVATESQGSILTLAGIDFAFMINNTIWNRSQRRPIFGPKSAMQWQELKAEFSSGPWISYRIRGNLLLFFPTPIAGQSVYFEWVSKYWATSTLAVNAASMTADTDVSRLDEQLHTLGGIWRFKRAKNLAYDEDFNKYEAAVNDAITRDGSKPLLNMGGEPDQIPPFVIIPAGNW